jgi:hypothetical protein
MADDDLWRRRFYAFMGVRLFGLATFVLGIAIMYTDLLREGGWPAVGAVLVVIGTIDAVFAPKMLRKLWERQDREGR